MPRPLRSIARNGVYHVTSRGNRRQAIAAVSQDFRSFKGLLNDVVVKYELVLHAWCVLDNHLHLVVQVPYANLSAAMQWLKGTYALRFNNRHGFRDHLFGPRFFARPITTDRDLVGVCEYVLANPSEAGIVELPEEWPWSSARGSTGLSAQDAFVSDSVLLAQYHTDRRRAQEILRFRLHARRDEPWVGLHRLSGTTREPAVLDMPQGLTPGSRPAAR